MVSLVVFLRLAATLFNDTQELLEFNNATLVIIYKVHDVLNLLTVIHQTQGYEGVFKLINSDVARAVVIQ